MFKEEQEFTPYQLSDLEETVLSELSMREKHYTIRFNGLRRLLKNVHQQKLSRALERLQESQLIERDQDGGYGLDSNSYSQIREYYKSQQKPLSNSLLDSETKKIFIKSSEYEFPVKDLVTKLTGKYFANFRFIGHYYANGEGRLEWIHSENNASILISSITPAIIEIIAQNIDQDSLNKFLHIIQQLLFEYEIIPDISRELIPAAN